MQEQGLETNQEKTSLPVGSRGAWISIHYEIHGTGRTHDFSTVQELARFFREKPDLGKLFGYTGKG